MMGTNSNVKTVDVRITPMGMASTFIVEDIVEDIVERATDPLTRTPGEEPVQAGIQNRKIKTNPANAFIPRARSPRNSRSYGSY